MHLNWKSFEKIFFNTVEAKVTIYTWYVKPYETIAINKFQRSGLTFDHSAKVSYIYILESYQYMKIVFSETTKTIELKFHMETQ